MPDPRRQRAVLVIFRVLFVLYSLALVGASFIPGASVPDTILGWDKAEHATAFFGLAFLTVVLIAPGRGWVWKTVSYGLAMGILTELLQGFSPGRMPSVFDVVADVVGTSVCVAAAYVWFRWFPRTRQRAGV